MNLRQAFSVMEIDTIEKKTRNGNSYDHGFSDGQISILEYLIKYSDNVEIMKCKVVMKSKLEDLLKQLEEIK